MKPNIRIVVLSVVALLVLAACAGPNELIDIPSANRSPAGFFWGIWHGMVLPLSFIGSLFSDNISIYEVHNTGGWYDFGFVLGAGVYTIKSKKVRKTVVYTRSRF